MITRAEIFELFDSLGSILRRDVKCQLVGGSLKVWKGQQDLTKDVDLVLTPTDMFTLLDELSIRDVHWFYLGYNNEYGAHHFGVDLRKYTDHYIPLDIFVQYLYLYTADSEKFGHLEVHSSDRQIR